MPQQPQTPATTGEPASSSAPAASAVSAALVAQIRGDLQAAAPVLDELGQRFADAGHELAVVGGPVRDAIMGRLDPVHGDLDFATSARPEETHQLVTTWADAVWEVGRAFGTIACRKGGMQLEITTYRQEQYDPTSRKPSVEYGDSLVGDLVRRDFTVNAMALRLPTWELVDPYDGLRDLHAGVLRTPAPATQSFSDDPLRMMRAARFVSQLGFTVHPDTFAAMQELASRLEIISAERIRVELVKLIEGQHPRAGVEMLVASGLADQMLPEVPNMRSIVDEHKRHKDVYCHSMTVMENAVALENEPGAEGPNVVVGPDFILRFAALMHDVAKPQTRKFTSDGNVTFYHHDVIGAKLTRKRMRALKFDNETTRAVCKLIELHLRFHGYGDADWTDSAVRRYVVDAGDQLARLHKLTRADCTSRNARKVARLMRHYDDLESRIDKLAAEEELKAVRPDLDGAQIMELLQIGPGPVVGKAYKHLLHLRMEHGPMEHDAAVAALMAWWAEQTQR